MAYDFTDPIQQNLFRQNALQLGKSEDEVNSYIAKRRNQQEIERYGVTGVGKANLPKTTDNKSLADLNEFEKKIVNARLSGQKALEVLNQGVEVSGPITTRLGAVGEFFGKPGKGTEYRSALNLASSQLFNALAGTTQSPAELKRLEKLIPKDTDQEATAKHKLNTLLGMLDNQAAAYGITIPGLSTTQTGASTDSDAPSGLSTTLQASMPPTLNITGSVAEPGDLVRGEDGKLNLYGEGNQEELFKIADNDSKSTVQYKLIKFLADSEFLPIAGSIAGGLSGAGIASVGTGAAGALAGKAAQQALRELLDPDRQDLSMAANAIVTEGIVDAVFGGLTLGTGKLIGKGYQLVLKRAGDVAEEGAEGTIKKMARTRAEKYVRKSSKITPTQSQKFLKQSGKTFESEAVNRGLVTGEEMSEEGLKILKTNKAKLTKLLGRTSASTDEVVKILEDAKKPFIRQVEKQIDTPFGPGVEFQDVVMPSARAGVKEIDDYIKWVKTYGDEISGKDLNKVKSGLQEIFGKSLDVSGTSRELVAKTSSKVKQYIEKFHPEIKGTNQEIIFGHLANELGDKSMSTQNAQALFSLTDLVTGAINMPVALIRKAMDQAVGANPEAKARLLVKMFGLAKEKSNRELVKKLTQTAQKEGFSFAIDPALLNTVKKVGVQTMEAAGANLALPNDPGIGVELGAYDPQTGAPLYK